MSERTARRWRAAVVLTLCWALPLSASHGAQAAKPRPTASATAKTREGAATRAKAPPAGPGAWLRGIPAEGSLFGLRRRAPDLFP